MDKCCRDKYFLDKSHRDSWNLFWIFLVTYLKSFIKSGVVTAEILQVLVQKKKVSYINKYRQTDMSGS